MVWLGANPTEPNPQVEECHENPCKHSEDKISLLICDIMLPSRIHDLFTHASYLVSKKYHKQLKFG